MRILIFICLLHLASIGIGQALKPDRVSLSYFGEMITHPGVRLSAHYDLHTWTREKKSRKKEKTIDHGIVLSPSVAWFHHRNYQNGIFFLPELGYHRKNQKGNFKSAGIGAGYLKTFIPNVYELGENNELEKIAKGDHYFAANAWVMIGKDLSVRYDLPFEVFLKPMFIYAVPAFPNGLGYAALELGLSYHI